MPFGWHFKPVLQPAVAWKAVGWQREIQPDTKQSKLLPALRAFVIAFPAHCLLLRVEKAD